MYVLVVRIPSLSEQWAEFRHFAALILTRVSKNLSTHSSKYGRRNRSLVRRDASNTSFFSNSPLGVLTSLPERSKSSFLKLTSVSPTLLWEKSFQTRTEGRSSRSLIAKLLVSIVMKRLKKSRKNPQPVLSSVRSLLERYAFTVFYLRSITDFVPSTAGKCSTKSCSGARYRVQA